jgi:4-diphosphocytidyl-2-C-methyl-D-erythritol kinase
VGEPALIRHDPAGPDFAEPAFAKINLTLRVVGRRTDGYHELESLVCFARAGDRLMLRAGAPLGLDVMGPLASAAGPRDQNLVLKAARALADRIDGLKLGHFTLLKRLPAGAGLGGGSADAAAALRLLAAANQLALNDPRLLSAALATGADVPVCLEQRPRMMRGIGELLSAPFDLPPLPAVMVFPGAPLATSAVFAAFRATGDAAAPASRIPESQNDAVAASALVEWLERERNDLEAAAISRLPAVADALSALRAQPGCRLARMSGSGSACFAIFPSRRSARTAARALAARKDWWVEATTFGNP